MLTIAAALLAFGLLVIVHEYGHYRVARACGVKVLRFSIGFGPVLWRRQAHPDATEFVLSALPLGGYVSMLDERVEPVPTALRHQAFNNRPLWQRSAVVLAGPLANLLLAVALYGFLAWSGQEELRPVLGSPIAGGMAERAGLRAGDLVNAASSDGQNWTPVLSMSELRWQLIEGISEQRPLFLRLSDVQGRGSRVAQLDLARLGTREPDEQAMRALGLGGVFSEPRLGKVTPGGPADRAGLRQGDLILSIDDHDIADAAQVITQVRAYAPDKASGAMQWRIERGAQRLSIEVQPMQTADVEPRVWRVQAEVGQPPATVIVSHPPLEALADGLGKTWDQSAMTLKIFGRMLIGQASLKNLSGPLSIADYAGQSARLGLSHYLGFLAMLSVGLGVLNLLPLPMLDGGHLMYYLFEGLSGRPVSEWWLRQLQRAGVMVMLLLMALALSNDLTRTLGLH